MDDTIDFRLRAATEAELAAALPWFRGTDPDGAPCWLAASHHHALDPIGPLVLTPALLVPETGEQLEPAVCAEGWHANLRLAEAHPEHAAIVVACAPLVVHPTNPRRAFA